MVIAKTMRGVILTTLLAVALPALAHDDQAEPGHKHEAPKAEPYRFEVEESGPIASPRAGTEASGSRSGQGFWTFTAATNGLLPIPEGARGFLKGAHGTLLVLPETDEVYWGLERVGWVVFRSGLTQSEIVKGHPAFSRGNLHGADLLPRTGKSPLVAAADNVDGEVYVSDTRFSEVATLGWPGTPHYQNKGEFHPTDVAFTGEGELYITDGYGRAFFMPAKLDPLKYEGSTFGGKSDSQTPHGITLDKNAGTLLVSARPEAQVRTWSLKDRRWVAVHGLPAGSTVCDVDLWGDYALMPCLDGPNRSPGPIYIVNLKKSAVVSTIKPKEELGFGSAQHIHDAAWYLRERGGAKELYIVFTYWNPGGIGAVKLAATRR